MDEDLPEDLEAEREALIAEIYAAFAGVSREGGVSWSESVVLDDYGSMNQRLAARAYDTDTSWEQLVEDPLWNSCAGLKKFRNPKGNWRDYIDSTKFVPGSGGYSFLDAIGFRYYLPVEMVRDVRSNHDEHLQYHLTLDRGSLKTHRLEKWSALDERQRLCIRRFLRYMAALALSNDNMFDARCWATALESYWGKLAED